MKLMSCDILIVGSGLTGLVAAHSLSLLGFKIILAEQKKILNNKNGILVEPEIPNQLSDAIAKLLNNSELREKLGLAGYNFVHKECNCLLMAKNSLKLYEDVLENNQNK